MVFCGVEGAGEKVARIASMISGHHQKDLIICDPSPFEILINKHCIQGMSIVEEKFRA